jgi:hypothetical protein
MACSTPAIAWRPKSLAGEYVVEDEEPTVRIPEFARLLAESLGEPGNVDDAPIEFPGMPCPVSAGTVEVPAARMPRAEPPWSFAQLRLVAFAILAGIAVAVLITAVRSGAATEIAQDSRAAARAFVGCPLSSQGLTRASDHPSILMTKHSSLRAAAAPRTVPRAVHRRAPAVRHKADSGIIRVVPF